MVYKNHRGLATQWERARSRRGRMPAAVRMLIEFAGKEPDLITEENSRIISFTARMSTSGLTTPCASATAAFVLRTRYRRLAYPEHPASPTRTPASCHPEQGGFRPTQSRALSQLRFPCHGLLCGLRLSEALSLQVSDIDGARMTIHVHAEGCQRPRACPIPP